MEHALQACQLLAMPDQQLTSQLTLFSSEPVRTRRYGPCINAWQPDLLAPPHQDDAADAVGYAGIDYCCPIHYVRYLRYKWNLDE
ncbi:hypothetical protein GCM10028818_56500 [Spirosoma horti]|uniref:hypothetical protein n=1 Tax=Spirosoma sp. TaxID=1899569 RepID=UPI002604B7C5|nr:hypothetical protein [Spirosoma sp.]MCX6213739.1 hypothetical protein [Spirosoma sp.]